MKNKFLIYNIKIILYLKIYLIILISSPFSGCYNKTKDSGTYTCVVCNEELFSSNTKFESGCGWPAFSDVIDQGKVKLSKDTSHSEHFFFFFVFLLPPY